MRTFELSASAQSEDRGLGCQNTHDSCAVVAAGRLALILARMGTETVGGAGSGQAGREPNASVKRQKRQEDSLGGIHIVVRRLKKGS